MYYNATPTMPSTRPLLDGVVMKTLTLCGMCGCHAPMFRGLCSTCCDIANAARRPSLWQRLVHWWTPLPSNVRIIRGQL